MGLGKGRVSAAELPGYSLEMPRSLSPSTAAKVAKLRAMVAALPPSERTPWEQAIAQAMAPTTVSGDGGGLLEGVRVIRPGEPGYAEAKAAEQARRGMSDVEWDLALANWAERAYDAASDRVAELATKAKEIAKANARELFTGSIGTIAAVGGGAALGALLLWKLSR